MWCVTNDTWIPFRLDAVKLSGDITKAHWERVAELVRLLASNQLVLRTGSSSDSSVCSIDSLSSSSSSLSSPLLHVGVDDRSSPTLSPLLEDATATEDANTPVDKNADNDLASETVDVLEENDCTRVEGDGQSNASSLLCESNGHRKTDADKNIEEDESNAFACDDLRSSCTTNVPFRKERKLRRRSNAVFSECEKPIQRLRETKSRRCSMPVLSNSPTRLLEDVVIRVDDIDEEKSTDDENRKYVPQETPNWLKLLQRYHDTKRLEKQIQRQREAWARNKRNLRRESVPKCMSGLSRYVFCQFQLFRMGLDYSKPNRSVCSHNYCTTVVSFKVDLPSFFCNN